MQIPSRNGICCDRCGVIYKTDFVYYSFDFRSVQVINNIRPSINDIFNYPIEYSIDICQQCFDNIKITVVSNYQSMMNDPNRRKYIICELSGAKMSDKNYKYYLCNVSEIGVKMTGQPNICVKCQNKSYSNEPCSKCGSVDFMIVANTNVVDRLLEINVCSNIFNEMVNTAKSIVQSEWSTES
jgi:hypothetical protein